MHFCICVSIFCGIYITTFEMLCFRIDILNFYETEDSDDYEESTTIKKHGRQHEFIFNIIFTFDPYTTRDVADQVLSWNYVTF